MTLTGGTAVNGTVAYTDATRTATFTPSAALAASTTYTVNLNGAKDRLFRLLVTVGDDTASKNAASRFLDSLKLAETRETKTTPVEPEKK